MLSSVEQGAQHTAWKGGVSGWTSPQSSGRKFLPEICVRKAQIWNKRCICMLTPTWTQGLWVLSALCVWLAHAHFHGRALELRKISPEVLSVGHTIRRVVWKGAPQSLKLLRCYECSETLLLHIEIGLDAGSAIWPTWVDVRWLRRPLRRLK